MSSTTTNLKLKLTGTSDADNAKKFGEWRQEINGETGGSNMEIIDREFGNLNNGKADKVSGATNGHLAALDATGNLKDSGKKASDFATAAQGKKADNAATEVANARASYANLNERLNAQNDSIEALQNTALTHRYGILWDKTNAKCTRLYDAVGLSANAHKGTYNAALVNDFDSRYPWSQRKVCNVDLSVYKQIHEAGGNIDEAIVAWEGDPDFSYTGANGAVMVYTPEFWMNTEEKDNGWEVVIADKAIPGWIHVPRYIGGRYFACDDGNGGITSIAGVIPMTNVTMKSIHDKATACGMTLDDIWTWTADSVLLAVEFATLDTQSAVGNGVSSVYREDASGDHPLVAETGANRVIAPVALANVAIANSILDIGTSKAGSQIGKRIVTSVEAYSGNSNYKIIHFSGGPVDITTEHWLSIHGVINTTDAQIGSSSGYIGTNSKAHAYYRGRIAHAGLWRYVLGAYRQTGTGHMWIANGREDAAACDAINTATHIDTGFVLPYKADGTSQAEGYIKEMYFCKRLPLFPFVKAVGGTSANPVGDYCYHPARTAGNTVLIAGGYAGNGAFAGRFCGRWSSSSGNSYWSISALPFLK